jgi:drug/metabolite transporter (DMT)-like permease
MLNDKPSSEILALVDDHPRPERSRPELMKDDILLNPKPSLQADIPRVSTDRQKRMALWMVIAFTLLASVAQIFIKTGANALNKIPAASVTALALGSMHFQISTTVFAAVTSIPLMGGLALYGIGAVMMVLALQHGELSVLYPVISLSYVWVAILSVLIFHEHMNAFRVGGIAVIIAGVAILGRSGSRSANS